MTGLLTNGMGEVLEKVGKDSRILFLANELLNEIARQGLDTTPGENKTYHTVTISYFEEYGTVEVKSSFAADAWCVRGKRT